MKKDGIKEYKKIAKRTDKYINDIEKAHKEAGKSNIVFKGENKESSPVVDETILKACNAIRNKTKVIYKRIYNEGF